MNRHTYTDDQGRTTVWWTPTEQETREAIASSLSHIHDWDLKEQERRMTRLNALYHADQRDLPNHPYRGCYTGLIEKNQAGMIGHVHWRLPDHQTGSHFAPVEES